ncbi:MAG: DUF996 domain-containing protein [Aquificaceae bacterium]
MENSVVNLNTPKLLGGIGMILILLSPFLLVTGIVGVVLVAVAMHKFSELLKEKDIFNKYIIGLVISIVSFFVVYLFGLGSLITGIFAGGLEFNLPSFGFGVMVAMLLAYILGIIAAYYYKRAYDILGAKTGQKMLSIGGLLWFIGNILLIAFGLGSLLILLGGILIAIGYFLIPDKMELSY